MFWEVVLDDSGDGWFWKLRDADKRIIVTSIVHQTREACLAEIELVKSASGAPVVTGQ